VQLHLEGNFQLGADAIHARNQHRVGIFLFIDGEQAAEAADFAQNTLGKSLMGEILDALLGLIATVNIHTGVGVGNTGRLACVGVLLRQLIQP